MGTALNTIRKLHEDITSGVYTKYIFSDIFGEHKLFSFDDSS